MGMRETAISMKAQERQRVAMASRGLWPDATGKDARPSRWSFMGSLVTADDIRVFGGSRRRR